MTRDYASVSVEITLLTIFRMLVPKHVMIDALTDVSIHHGLFIIGSSCYKAKVQKESLFYFNKIAKWIYLGNGGVVAFMEVD